MREIEAAARSSNLPSSNSDAHSCRGHETEPDIDRRLTLPFRLPQERTDELTRLAACLFAIARIHIFLRLMRNMGIDFLKTGELPQNIRNFPPREFHAIQPQGDRPQKR
jgi:hypothetical protein